MDKWIKQQEVVYSTKGSSESTEAVKRQSCRVVAVMEHIRSGEKIIDLGCNDGGLSKEIADRGNEVISVDLPEVIKIARAKYPTLSFIAVDLSQEFAWEDNSFDVAVASEIVEHMIDDIAFLQNCHRILKKGGRLLLTTPNVAYIRNRIRLLRGKCSERDVHAHDYTFDSLGRKVKRAGFKIIQEQPVRRDNANPSWHYLECFLPKTFASGIFICAIT